MAFLLKMMSQIMDFMGKKLNRKVEKLFILSILSPNIIFEDIFLNIMIDIIFLIEITQKIK